jgi:hypothetical protein
MWGVGMKVLSKITLCLCFLTSGQTLSAYYYHSGYYNREASWAETQGENSRDYDENCGSHCGYQSTWYQGSLNPFSLIMSALAQNSTNSNSTFGTPSQTYGSKPLSGTDAEVSERVRNALSTNPKLSSEKISVSVENGRVTLTGDVTNTSDKNKVASAVRRIKGVTSVNNQITIKK